MGKEQRLQCCLQTDSKLVDSTQTAAGDKYVTWHFGHLSWLWVWMYMLHWRAASNSQNKQQACHHLRLSATFDTFGSSTRHVAACFVAWQACSLYSV